MESAQASFKHQIGEGLLNFARALHSRAATSRGESGACAVLAAARTQGKASAGEGRQAKERLRTSETLSRRLFIQNAGPR
jgi:hypothetical protein